MAFELTRGAIEKILTGVDLERPVLQVLGQKKIAGSGGSDRYRLLLSDGIHSHSSAMLATQLNNLVQEGDVDTYAVIRLDKFICNTIQPDRRVMIILELTVIARGSDVNQRIGNPQPFKNAGAGAAQQETKPPTNQQPLAPKPLPNGNVNTGGQTTPARKPPMFGGRGGAPGTPNTPGGTPMKVHPISSLTPYQNRWCIKARVTHKATIRHYSNSRGEGKLFSMNFLDESGEIRATAFNQQVDKFYDMLELNKAYYVRKASLKTADKRYSSVNNDYEMTFNNDTEVILCEDDVDDLPSLSFNFIPINQMESHQPNSTVDVIGVVKNVFDVSTIIGKASNKEVKKRDLQLVDENQVLIRLTLWGNDAETFDGSGNPVLAIKGARLSDWGGRSLSASGGSQIILNPDIPEAHHIKGWYDSVGHSVEYNEFRSDGQGGGAANYSTNWKTFAEVKGQNFGAEKPEYFTCKGTVIFLKKENCMYMACPKPDCNKKLVDQANGSYRCEKCQQDHPNYKWRMILSANVADYSDSQWITCFQDTAETMLGKTGDELGTLREQDEAAFDQVFSEASFKSYIFKMRAKVETYNDESRLKTICVSSSPIDYKEYNQKLITDIEKMLSG